MLHYTGDMDIYTISNAMLCTILFILIMIWASRFYAEHGFKKWLIRVFIITTVCNLGGSIGLGLIHIRQNTSLNMAQLSLWMAISFAIYATSCYLYIICIMGPYETSIRIRLIRELFSAHPKELTKEEILARYNAQVILKKRLDRLVATGEVIVDDNQQYRIGKRPHIFFAVNMMWRLVKKLARGNDD